MSVPLTLKLYHTRIRKLQKCFSFKVKKFHIIDQSFSSAKEASYPKIASQLGTWRP